MNQGTYNPAQNIKDINSIFKNKPKPISYVKGDIMHLAEISEDNLIIHKKSAGNPKYTDYEIGVNKALELNVAKKGMSYDKIHIERQINSEINKAYCNEESNTNINYNGHYFKEHNEVTRASGAVDSLPSKNANIKIGGMSNYSNIEDQEVNSLKSQGQPDEKSHNLKRYQSDHLLPNYIEKGVKPSDTTEDPFIFSRSSLHVLSFLTGAKALKRNTKNNHLNNPSPTFIDHKEWQMKPKLTKQDILEGMIVDDKKGLVLVDKNIMKKFRGIISDMIKQILAVWLRPISLKVNLFEPKSILHRITDYWSFAPHFLNKAALADSALERMKYVIAFAVSGFYIPTKQLKPFNPLIGETFQGEFENGAKVYVEHISHYPNYARFLIIDDLYKIHGYFEFNAKTEGLGSKLTVTQHGPITIEFLKTKDTVVFNMPIIKLMNASSEEGRSAIWTGTIVFSDVKNNLQAFTQFAVDDKYVHGFTGLIIENIFPHGPYHHYEYVKKYEATKDWQKNKNLNVSKKLGYIRGSWLNELRIDEELIWDINTHVPNWIRPSTKVLPSDGRFREDLIWLFRSFNSLNETQRIKYEEYAQGWKVAIEQVQRAEREIRKKNRKKNK